MAPSYGEGWRTRARLPARLERYDEAGAAARRATELLARDPRAWHILGNALQALGRDDEAVTCWERSVALGHAEKDRIRKKIARAAQG